MQQLYDEQTRDIQALREKTAQLKQITRMTGETIDNHNELLDEMGKDMDDAQEKLKRMKEKTKTALSKVGKKGALCGTLGTISIFVLLWFLLG